MNNGGLNLKFSILLYRESQPKAKKTFSKRIFFNSEKKTRQISGWDKIGFVVKVDHQSHADATSAVTDSRSPPGGGGGPACTRVAMTTRRPACPSVRPPPTNIGPRRSWTCGTNKVASVRKRSGEKMAQ